MFYIYRNLGKTMPQYAVDLNPSHPLYDYISCAWIFNPSNGLRSIRTESSQWLKWDAYGPNMKLEDLFAVDGGEWRMDSEGLFLTGPNNSGGVLCYNPDAAVGTQWGSSTAHAPQTLGAVLDVTFKDTPSWGSGVEPSAQKTAKYANLSMDQAGTNDIVKFTHNTGNGVETICQYDFNSNDYLLDKRTVWASHWPRNTTSWICEVDFPQVYGTGKHHLSRGDWTVTSDDKIGYGGNIASSVSGYNNFAVGGTTGGSGRYGTCTQINHCFYAWYDAILSEADVVDLSHNPYQVFTQRAERFYSLPKTIRNTMSNGASVAENALSGKTQTITVLGDRFKL